MKRIALFAITIAMLIMTACPKVNPEGPGEMVLETTELTLPAEGGEVELKFTPLSSWTAQCEDSWVKYSPASGDASEEEVVLVIKAGRNSGEARTSELLLSFETNDVVVTITQEGSEGGVEIKQTEYTVSADGEEFDVKFVAPTDWEASCKAQWVTLDPDSGEASTKKTKMTVTVAANNTYEERTAVVLIEFEDEDVEITITQEAKKKVEATIEKTAYQVSEQGGVVAVEFVPLTDWKAVTTDEYISIAPDEGKAAADQKKVTVNVTVEPNLAEGSRKRTATIKFQFKDNEVVVTILQDGAGPKVTLDQTNFTDVSWKGDMLEVSFTPEADTEWKVTGGQSFVECTPVSGTAGTGENSVVTLKVFENTTTKVRTATLLFEFENNSVEVTVTQEARPADVTVEPGDISVPASGGEYRVQFTPTTDWTLECSGFVHCDNTSGSASTRMTTVMVTVEENTSASSRNGYVEISFETNTVRVSINQDPASGGSEPEPGPEPDPEDGLTGGTEDVNKGDDVTLK